MKKHVIGEDLTFVAIHKRRWNILGWEWRLKFRCCKILEGRSLVNQDQNSDLGEGVSKTAKKIPTSFMDGPLGVSWTTRLFTSDLDS